MSRREATPGNTLEQEFRIIVIDGQLPCGPVDRVTRCFRRRAFLGLSGDGVLITWGHDSFSGLYLRVEGFLPSLELIFENVLSFADPCQGNCTLHGVDYCKQA